MKSSIFQKIEMLFCLLGVDVMTNAHSKYALCAYNYPIPVLTQKLMRSIMMKQRERATVRRTGRKQGDYAYGFHWSWSKMVYIMTDCKNDVQQNGKSLNMFTGWADTDLPDWVAALYIKQS